MWSGPGRTALRVLPLSNANGELLRARLQQARRRGRNGPQLGTWGWAGARGEAELSLVRAGLRGAGPPTRRGVQEGLGWTEKPAGPSQARSVWELRTRGLAFSTHSAHFPAVSRFLAAKLRPHPGPAQGFSVGYLERIPSTEVKREDEMNVSHWGQNEWIGRVDGKPRVDQVQELPAVHCQVFDVTCGDQEETQ